MASVDEFSDEYRLDSLAIAKLVEKNRHNEDFPVWIMENDYLEVYTVYGLDIWAKNTRYGGNCHIKCACAFAAVKILEYILNADLTKQYMFDHIKYVGQTNHDQSSLIKCYYLMLPRTRLIKYRDAIFEDICKLGNADLWKFTVKIFSVSYYDYIYYAFQANMVECLTGDKLDVLLIDRSFWRNYTYTTETLIQFLDLYTLKELERILTTTIPKSIFWNMDFKLEHLHNTIQDYVTKRQSRGTHTKAASSKLTSVNFE